MNDKRGFERIAAEWLDDGSDVTPPEVIGAVLLAVRSTPQERDFRILWRASAMPMYLRAAAVIAIVAFAGAATLYAFGLGPNVGSGRTPEPTTQGTLTQPSTASPSQILGGPPSDCIDLWADGGTYRATDGTLSVTATVPAGWHGLRGSFYLLKAPCVFGGPVLLEVTLVSHVYSDSCEWLGTGVEASTPAAVTAALAAQQGHETTGPIDVSLAGYPASQFEFSVPADFDASTCGDGSLPLWLAPGGRSPSLVGEGMQIDPGQTMTVYVVDVGGLAVGVAATRWEGDATPAEIAELDAVVESLRFEP